jgi:hypothetical protein
VCKYVVHDDCKAKAADNCPPTCFSKEMPTVCTEPFSNPFNCAKICGLMFLFCFPVQGFYHFWIEGNLDGSCNVCNTTLSMSTITYGHRCFWCNRQLCRCAARSQRPRFSPLTKLTTPDPSTLVCATHHNLIRICVMEVLYIKS